MQLSGIATLLLVLATPGLAAPARKCRPRSSALPAPAVSTPGASIPASVPVESATASAPASAVVPTGGNENAGEATETAVTPPASEAPSEASAAPSAEPTESAPESSAAPAPAPTGGNSGGGSLIPNGRKAGISGEVPPEFIGKIGWHYNWTPVPPEVEGSVGIPMLWGNGQFSQQDDIGRKSLFESLDPRNVASNYVFGFQEPDCKISDSASQIDVATAAGTWNALFRKWRDAGKKLISPSMCHQIHDEWLWKFEPMVSDLMWDITAVHINKLTGAEFTAVIDHYWNTFQKPIIIKEFACVDDKNGFYPSNDEGQIINYIREVVPIAQKDSRVIGFAFSTGEGLGQYHQLTKDGQLTNVGRAYLDAISA